MILEEQIIFLWSQTNKRTKKCSNTFPKFIYTFEFVNNNRSGVDHLGLSSSYLGLTTFKSLKVKLFLKIQQL